MPPLPKDRAIRIYPTEFLMRTMTVDDRAVGFYTQLLLYCDADPVIPSAIVNELAGSRYMRRRFIRDLSSDWCGLLLPEGRDLRLVEWLEPSSRWRWFGRPGENEPVAALSLIERVDRRRPIPVGLRDFVIERDGRICGICGLPVGFDVALDIDHIVPIARGGTDDRDNLQVSHASCNRSKGARLPAETR